MNIRPTSDLAKRLTNVKKTMTRPAAIAAGMAICEAAERMTFNNPGQQGDVARHAARGACIYALDNIWYDCIPPKVAESFGLSKETFYKECGWPD